jgi:hypothetical protein
MGWPRSATPTEIVMPIKILKAIAYALLIWITGFVWGSIVFMTPALKSVAAIPYVSKNPAISFPILAIWPILTFLLARSYLKNVPDRATEGLRLGITFAFMNLILDLVVLVFLLKAGFGYFISLTVWLAYLTLLIIPWLAGRRSA